MKISAGPNKRPKETLITIDNFKGGSNSLVDEARMDKKYAVESVNQWQVQDGLWETRPGFAYFGASIAGESSIDGAGEYLKSDGTTELIAIGGTTGKVWKSVDGGAWSEVSGATFTVGNKCFFIQVGGYLYITNGIDDLARYDGSTLSKYTELDPPENLGLARGAGLSAGSYTYYYQVTAVNSIGETQGCSEVSITVDKDRETWTDADEIITVTFDAVAGATRYNVYLSDESGYEVYLKSTAATTYVDDGSDPPNPYIEVPDDNTTSAPKFTQMELSGNRLWATNDPDNAYRVYFSGTGQYMGFFSPFYEGGYIDLEKGGRDTPTGVVHYRTGKGDSIATVLCSSPDGSGSIWQVELTSTTVGDVTFIVPAAFKIVGSIGSDAPRGIVKARDNILFPNKKGVYALRNKEQMYQVLATDELSAPERPRWLNLRGSAISQICSYYKDGRVYFSVPDGSDENSKIVIFDMERGNWNWAWSVGVRQFLEYTETSGTTKFLAVPTSGNRLYEISDSVIGDFGSPFYQSYISPLLKVSENYTDVYKVREAIVELGRPKGTVQFEITGIEKTKGFSNLGSTTITNFGSNSGIGTDAMSDFKMSDSNSVPETYTQATVKKSIRLSKRVYAIQFKVYSNSGDTKYTILGLQARGYLLPGRSPSSWRQ
jgi:hypothetical protein